MSKEDQPTKAQLRKEALAHRQRIQADYAKLRALSEAMDRDYSHSDDPNVGFRVGHYDDERQEIQFYGIEEDRIAAFREALDSVAIENGNGLQDKYELYQTYVMDDLWLFLLRPRLID